MGRNVTSKQLEKFVEECQSDFKVINDSLNAFNIFNVLKIQHREIRHSNFLGWLFDPNETHQLGDVFLKGLFRLILQIELIDSEQFNNLVLQDLHSSLVYRETVHNIDILIINEKMEFIICIENKIHAAYSHSQLLDYFKYVEGNYNSYKKIFITLTPKKTYHHSDKDAGENYSNISYIDILKILENNNNQIQGAIPTVKESINQYISMVKKDITKTSDEVKIAREIYKNYKEEIDFIISKQLDFTTKRKEIVSYFEYNKSKDFKFFDYSNKRVIQFLPENNSLLKLFNYNEAKSWGGDYLFTLIIYLDRDRVWIKWGFGNIEDSDKKDILEKIKTELFNKMKNFKVFKNAENLNVNHKSKGEDKFPGVVELSLFNDIQFEASGLEFIKFFEQEFDKANEGFIQPWVEECIEKLGSVNQFT